MHVSVWTDLHTLLMAGHIFGPISVNMGVWEQQSVCE